MSLVLVVLATVTVEDVCFLCVIVLKKKKKKVLSNNDNNNTSLPASLSSPPHTNSYCLWRSKQDVFNNTFLKLTVESSIFYYCLLWKMIISLQNISINLYLCMCTCSDLTFVACVCVQGLVNVCLCWWRFLPPVWLCGLGVLISLFLFVFFKTFYPPKLCHVSNNHIWKYLLLCACHILPLPECKHYIPFNCQSANKTICTSHGLPSPSDEIQKCGPYTKFILK